MAQADSVPIANRAPITGATSNGSTKRVRPLRHYFVERPSSSPTPLSSHILVLCYATAVLLLGWWPWNSLLILLLFACSNFKRGSSV
jgi:hypothetical protein